MWLKCHFLPRRMGVLRFRVQVEKVQILLLLWTLGEPVRINKSWPKYHQYTTRDQDQYRIRMELITNK